jgi:hypothetical protein
VDKSFLDDLRSATEDSPSADRGLFGKAYTAQLGLEPGDEYEIKLGRKQIQLIPLGAAEREIGLLNSADSLGMVGDGPKGCDRAAGLIESSSL